jgi:hypothetical protein
MPQNVTHSTKMLPHKQQSRQPIRKLAALPSPIRCFWGGNVWGSRTGVQVKRPDPTKESYALRGRPQAAFSWRWNSNSKAVGGTQPTALPSSPIRVVFSDGIHRVVETGQ